MGVYFGETEITNIDNLVPQAMQDITQAFFGSTEVFTVWGKYDGILPATYTANGSMLADYRIYGASGGVGDDSGTAYGYEVDMVCGENQYNENTTIDGQRIYWATGGVYYDSNAATSDYISVQAGDTYIFTNAVFFIGYAVGNVYLGAWNGLAFEKNGEMPERKDITVPSGCEKIRLVTKDKALLHGNVKLTHGDVIPIYIGSDPLGEDEYVDYVAGKIYRRTAQLFNKNTVVKDCYISLNGEIQNVNYSCSDFIPISAGSYYLKNVTGSSIQNSAVVYDANKRALRYANVSGSYTAKGAITFTDGDAYIRVNIYTLTNLDTVDIIAGSIEPTEHIPYVAPVDPPVPLPALPTVDGVTITDYAGQSAAVPSRFSAKYRKEGF